MKIKLEKNDGGVPMSSPGRGKPIELQKKKEEKRGKSISGRERSEKNVNNLS